MRVSGLARGWGGSGFHSAEPHTRGSRVRARDEGERSLRVEGGGGMPRGGVWGHAMSQSRRVEVCGAAMPFTCPSTDSLLDTTCVCHVPPLLYQATRTMCARAKHSSPRGTYAIGVCMHVCRIILPPCALRARGVARPLHTVSQSTRAFLRDAAEQFLSPTDVARPAAATHPRGRP